MVKQSLLFSAILLLSGTAMANVQVTRNASMPVRVAPVSETVPELKFSYADLCEKCYDVVGINRGSTMVYGAVKFRHEELQRFVGNSITGITYVSGAYADNYVNPLQEIEVFITKDLNQEPVRLQKSQTLMESALAENRINLDEPYLITADDDVLYFGVRFVAPETKGACYLATDECNDCSTNQIIGLSDDGNWPTEWTETGLVDGNLGVGLILSGDALPANNVAIVNSVFPSFVLTGDVGTYTLHIKNMGTEPVSNYVVSTKIGSSEPDVQKREMPEGWPIRVGSTVRHKIENVPFKEEGYLPVEISILEINGETVENPQVYKTEGLSYFDGFDRNVLIEEFGGPTCGWCPAGYELIEYANATYPGRMIAVDAQVNTDDQCPDYQEFIDANVPSIPYTWFNRVRSEIPAYANMGSAYPHGLVDEVFGQADAMLAYCKVTANAKMNDETNKVDVTAEAEFSMSFDRPHRFSFILTEDNVGPFNQLNNYAGGTFGEMAGWENLDLHVSKTFDNVVRVCQDFDGIPDSCPESIKKGQKVSCTTSIPVGDTTGGKLKVVALIIDTVTGEVMNAERVDVSGGAGVGSIGNDSGISIVSENGSITVSGASDVKFYNLAGMRLAKAENLSAGVYLVVADGKSFKVAVK